MDRGMPATIKAIEQELQTLRSGQSIKPARLDIVVNANGTAYDTSFVAVKPEFATGIFPEGYINFVSSTDTVPFCKLYAVVSIDAPNADNPVYDMYTYSVEPQPSSPNAIRLKWRMLFDNPPATCTIFVKVFANATVAGTVSADGWHLL